MIRAALYIRVSTDEQALHGVSLDTQKEMLTRYAKENDMLVVGTYIDDGYTASKLNRPALQRLLEDVRKNALDIIIITKLDRWFRSVRDYYKIQEVLETHNVNWKTILENYDTTTANGRLHINIMLSVAEDEVARTSERIKVVFENKVRHGEAICGKTPLGLKIKDKRLVPDENTVHIVRDVFDYFETHRSKHATEAFILEKYGVHLERKTLQTVLSNPLYKGVYRDNLHYCEPIIVPERFDMIQTFARGKIVRKTPTNRTYIFAGMAFCAECGYTMCGRAANQGKSYESYYYRCNKYTNHQCSHKKLMGEKAIEEYLLENVRGELERFIIGQKAEIKAAPKPRVDKNKIRKKLERLKDLYINELISLDDYKKDFEAYQKQLEEVPEAPEKDLTRLKQLEEFLDSAFEENYVTLERETKRAMWRQIIKKIVIDANNNVSIFFA